jgi:hypothetical protein
MFKPIKKIYLSMVVILTIVCYLNMYCSFLWFYLLTSNLIDKFKTI